MREENLTFNTNCMNYEQYASIKKNVINHAYKLIKAYEQNIPNTTEFAMQLKYFQYERILCNNHRL